jgi:hypothetical protein
MITASLLAITFAIATLFARYAAASRRQLYAVHLLAVSAALIVIVIVRAAATGSFAQCSLVLSGDNDRVSAQVPR